MYTYDENIYSKITRFKILLVSPLPLFLSIIIMVTFQVYRRLMANETQINLPVFSKLAIYKSFLKL